MNQSEGVRTHLNQLSIIASAIIAGVAIFAVVVWYLLSTGAMPPQDMDLPGWMGTGFNALALVMLVKAYLLPRIFSRPGQGAPEEAMLAWHKKTTIVGFALREAAAFTALVGAMLTAQIVGAIVMVGLTFVTMILTWPRAAQIRA